MEGTFKEGEHKLDSHTRGKITSRYGQTIKARGSVKNWLHSAIIVEIAHGWLVDYGVWVI